METLAIRLKPGMDLKDELSNLVKKNKIKSGFIITCVGSLQGINIRLSDLSIYSKKENFEILSLVGTLCGDGLHLHISISDSTGKAFGGHLLNGNIIHTTAEIVLGCESSFKFKRELDKQTNFKELKIEHFKLSHFV
jgi:uncharacterized protein